MTEILRLKCLYRRVLYIYEHISFHHPCMPTGSTQPYLAQLVVPHILKFKNQFFCTEILSYLITNFKRLNKARKSTRKNH